MGWSRRALMRGGLLAGAGAVVALSAERLPAVLGPDRLPLDGGYAPAGNPVGWTPRGEVRTIWHVPTDQPWVALTFDDGPAPDWTPRVMDTLDRLDATATFFVVGERLRANAKLIRGRYDRHEVGNHTWQHKDLAQRDEAGVRDQLTRCHEAIKDVLGRTPTLMRPPWGHAGGTTLTVADELGYNVVMWSRAMPESLYKDRPADIVPDVVGGLRPGAILLAHDVGDSNRLVTIGNLGALVEGIRSRGFQLVTVSKLLSAERAGSHNP